MNTCREPKGSIVSDEFGHVIHTMCTATKSAS